MNYSPKLKIATGTTSQNKDSTPDFSFPSVKYGERESPWNLSILLYKGGAKQNSRLVGNMIKNGDLGTPRMERLSLVRALHIQLNGKIITRGSRQTLHTEITFIRRLFKWADDENLSLTLDSIQETYFKWADSLLHDHRIKKCISMRSAYTMAACVGTILDRVLDRQSPNILLTGLYFPPHSQTAASSSAEKQNLNDTFIFGKLIQDICDALTLETVLESPLPINIPLRSGRSLSLWSGAKPRWSMEGILRYQTEGTLRTRFPLANLRIESELMMFIAQTGMNLTQAANLKISHFSYVSHLQGYWVKDRKNRRGGDVLFEIFKDYRPHLERYLSWRRKLFPEDLLLFPFVRAGGAMDCSKMQGDRIRSICKTLGTPYISARFLRNTRVNWLLRESGDPEITSEMAQHSKETLLHVYERPSQQRAMGEIVRFWSRSDPRSISTEPILAGECSGHPQTIKTKPREAPKPDCIRPSGCLWCEHHRDIDSLDYVWSLTSFRHLKKIEISRNPIPSEHPHIHPAEHALIKINKKIKHFESIDGEHLNWVKETQTRIEEGDYHPNWKNIINHLELPA